MLIKGSHVIGSKVISVNDGKEIEDVDDIIYDPLDNRVKALLVDEGGLFSAAKVILLEDTKSIGENAVLVDSDKALKNASDVSHAVSDIAKGNTYLTRTKIVSEEGMDLGIITDIFFDSDTGRVEEFEVSQGLEDVRSGKKRIKIADIVTVGKDATIVREYTQDQFKKQAEQQGLGGIVNQGMVKAREGISRAQEETPGLVEQAKVRIDQWGKEIKQMTADTMDQVEELRKKGEELPQKEETRETIQKIEDKTRDTLKQVQQEVRTAEERLHTGIEDVGTKTKQQFKEDAVGKYVTKNILLPDDKILIRRGEIVTYKVINGAEESGILDQILRNLSTEPVKKK